MQSRKIPCRSRPRRSAHREREGAVMLVVLLILLTATTLAATSLQATQFELRSSGYNRAALQTEYISEAAAMTTMVWVDTTSLDRSFLRHLEAANLKTLSPPPMSRFGEPDILSDNRANANRTQWVQQSLLTGSVTLPPITQAGFSNADATFTDPVGTLGPRSAYVPGIQNPEDASINYVVDMYDCRQIANTSSVGYQINQGGSGTMRYFQYYCVVTSRGRSYVPYPAGGAAGQRNKTWSINTAAGPANYIVNRFTMAHDSRGAIVTPPISQ